MSCLQHVYAADVSFESLRKVNGVCVSELERRAAPLDDKRADRDAWRVRSHAGFLAPPHTSLRACLAADWRTVCDELDTSHEELASLVRALLREVERARVAADRGAMASIVVDFDSRPHTDAPTLRCDEPQCVVATRQIYAGAQFSLFARGADADESAADSHSSRSGNSTSTSAVAASSTSAGDGAVAKKTTGTATSAAIGDSTQSIAADELDENMRWAFEFTLHNRTLGLSVLLGGGLARDGSDVGVLSYIARYGFYEGGDGNAYRVPPLVLVAVLTGRAHRGLCAELERRHAASLALFEQQQRALRAECDDALRKLGKDSTDGEAARAWFAAELDKLSEEIATRDAQHQRTMAKLRVAEESEINKSV